MHVGVIHFNVEGQMEDFENNHELFQQQLACRNEQIRGDLVSEFDLEKEVTVNLAIQPDSSGSIMLNTIHPTIYPWSGVYFDGVPIQVNCCPGLRVFICKLVTKSIYY
jgi:hypothetical protein